MMTENEFFENLWREHRSTVAKLLRRHGLTKTDATAWANKLSEKDCGDETPAQTVQRLVCKIENDDGKDFVLYIDESISLLTPKHEGAKLWIKENVNGEQTWLGNGLVVEHRYISDLLGGIDYDGLTVEEL